jgi:hypothetical protein
MGALNIVHVWPPPNGQRAYSSTCGPPCGPPSASVRPRPCSSWMRKSRRALGASGIWLYALVPSYTRATAFSPTADMTASGPVYSTDNCCETGLAVLSRPVTTRPLRAAGS